MHGLIKGERVGEGIEGIRAVYAFGLDRDPKKDKTIWITCVDGEIVFSVKWEGAIYSTNIKEMREQYERYDAKGEIDELCASIDSFNYGQVLYDSLMDKKYHLLMPLMEILADKGWNW